MAAARASTPIARLLWLLPRIQALLLLLPLLLLLLRKFLSLCHHASSSHQLPVLARTSPPCLKFYLHVYNSVFLLCDSARVSAMSCD
jgi:hypothetical protein